jgi:hypothetical protein
MHAVVGIIPLKRENNFIYRTALPVNKVTVCLGAIYNLLLRNRVSNKK